MKHFVWILVLACGLMQAAQGQAGGAPQTGAKAKARPAAGLTVPPGAEKVEEGLWRAKDAQGRTWIYKRTPFGLVRMEEEQKAAAPAGPSIRVVEVRGKEAVFERQSPFGRKTWTRKAEEMDEEERRALEEWKKAKR